MAELALSIVAHAVLGVALAVVVWALGLGWLRLVPLPRPAFAYPLGLLAVTIAAWLWLVSPWLVAAAILLVVPVVFGLRAALVAVAPAAPFAAGLGIALGSLLHGPTASEDSHAYGDMLFYAAKLVSAAESVLPFRDLLVEGVSSTYAESGSTFVGAALGVDPILFQAAAMPAFLLAALGLGFRLLGVRADGRSALVLALLGVGVIAYPTWVTESPPVAFALPLAFAVVALARERLSLGAIAASVVLLGLCFALTKGFGVIPLGVATAFALARHRRELDRRRVALYAAVPVAVALAGIVFFAATSGWLTEVLGVKFLPADAVDGLRTQFDRRDTQAVAPAFLVVGELLIGIALVRAEAWFPLAMFAAGVAGNWLVSGHGFDIAVGIGVVATLLFFADDRIALREQLPLVLAGGAALALAAAFRDISGVRAGVVLSLLLAGGVFAALVPARATAVGAAAVAAGVGVGLVAGRSDVGLASPAVTLTPNDYAVWKAVDDVVPRDGLVFTSLTGPRITGDQGWNYYPGIAGRQVYLAGWSSSPLLVDEAERQERLSLNQAVLAGEIEPSAVPLSERYSRFYAVVRRREPVPNALRATYQNEDYTLYELP